MKQKQSWEFHSRRLHHLLVAFRNLSADLARSGAGICPRARKTRTRRSRTFWSGSNALAKGRHEQRVRRPCRPPSARTTSRNISRSSSAKNQLHPTTFILNQLQRDASGKIKLGLDLQGGTSFLVEMDTNVLLSADTNNVAVAAGLDERGAVAGGRSVAQAR